VLFRSGAVPGRLAPQQILVSDYGYNYLSASDYVRSSTGEIFAILYNSIIRYKLDGTYAVFAGSNVQATVNGIGTAASFQHLNGIAIDAVNNLYVTEDNDKDIINKRVRKITQAGLVTTYAEGLNASGITVSKSGIVYLTDPRGQILKITPDGIISVLAGQKSFWKCERNGHKCDFFFTRKHHN